MNAVVVAVATMLLLSIVRLNVVMSLIIGALVGGLVGGLDFSEAIKAFNEGLGGGAEVALSYALLGAFAVAVARSGLPHWVADKSLIRLNGSGSKQTHHMKWLIITVLAAVAMSSQNLIPVHIAFIPMLIPPLLIVFAKLQLDRRLVACVLTFGLITPYIFLPVGFGGIFLNNILLANIAEHGMDISQVSVIQAMALPALGMLIGLLVAAFFSYRKPRQYSMEAIKQAEKADVSYSPRTLLMALLAIAATFIVQLTTNSMVLGALLGFLLFSISGVFKWSESDGLFVEGMKMMAMVGFIMIAAKGFAAVLQQTGEIQTLVDASSAWFGSNKVLAALVMLLVGLLITMGIGSSFSTIPIIAAIYVPLAIELGFSPMATIALVGTAAALGDAGSPTSDSTLGPTAGLNVDGQHNHIWDTVVPTFIHYNIPLLIFGWAAAMVL